MYSSREQSTEAINQKIETIDLIKIWKYTLKSLIENTGNRNEPLIDAIIKNLIPCLTAKFINITTSASCLKTSFKDIYSLCKMADYQVHIKHDLPEDKEHSLLSRSPREVNNDHLQNQAQSTVSSRKTGKSLICREYKEMPTDQECKKLGKTTNTLLEAAKCRLRAEQKTAKAWRVLEKRITPNDFCSSEKQYVDIHACKEHHEQQGTYHQNSDPYYKEAICYSKNEALTDDPSLSAQLPELSPSNAYLCRDWKNIPAKSKCNELKKYLTRNKIKYAEINYNSASESLKHSTCKMLAEEHYDRRDFTTRAGMELEKMPGYCRELTVKNISCCKPLLTENKVPQTHPYSPPLYQLEELCRHFDTQNKCDLPYNYGSGKEKTLHFNDSMSVETSFVYPTSNSPRTTHDKLPVYTTTDNSVIHSTLSNTSIDIIIPPDTTSNTSISIFPSLQPIEQSTVNLTPPLTIPDNGVINPFSLVSGVMNTIIVTIPTLRHEINTIKKHQKTISNIAPALIVSSSAVAISMAPLFAGVGLISSGTAAGISAIGNGGFIVSGIPGIIKSIKDYRQLSSMQEGVPSGALRQCKLKERQESLRKVYQSICSGFATKVAYASLNIAQTLSNSSLLSLGSILSLLFSGISQQASTCNKSDIKLEPNDNLLNIPSGKELSFFTSQIFALFCGAEIQDKLLSLTGRTMDSESEKSFCAELIDSYLEILSKKEQCASNLNELKEKSHQELDKIFRYGKADLSSIKDRLLIMLLSCIHTEVQNDKAYCRNAKGLYSAQHLQKNMIEPIIKVFAYYEMHNSNHSHEGAALLAHTSCEREQDEEEGHSAIYMGNQSVQYRRQITKAVYV